MRCNHYELLLKNFCERNVSYLIILLYLSWFIKQVKEEKMSQCHNTILYNFVQPSLFVAAAFITAQVIEASQGRFPIGGVVLSSVVGNSVILVGQRWIGNDNESARYSLARVITILALSTICVFFITKYVLKERADVFVTDGLLFCLIASGVAVPIALTSHYITLNWKNELETLKAEYCQDERKWDQLSSGERAQFIEQLYRADIPFDPQLMMKAPKDTLLNYRKDFHKISATQRDFHIHLSRYYDRDILIQLNRTLCAKNMVWGERGLWDLDMLGREGQEVVKNYFITCPIAFYRLLENSSTNQLLLLNGLRKEIPDLYQFLQEKEVHYFENLIDEDLDFLIMHFESQKKRVEDEIYGAHHVDVSYISEKQAIWCYAIRNTRKPDCAPTHIATQKIYDELLNMDVNSPHVDAIFKQIIAWFHNQLTSNFQKNAELSDVERDFFNMHFSKRELSCIDSPQEKCFQFIPSNFEKLAINYQIHEWHKFFKNHPDVWNILQKCRPTIVSVFINQFIEHNLPYLKTDKCNIEEIECLPLRRIRMLRSYSLEWFQSLSTQFPDLPYRSEIEKRLEQLKQEQDDVYAGHEGISERLVW